MTDTLTYSPVEYEGRTTLSGEQIRFYVATVRWQFAKTMPANPHEYTVKKWANPEMFERMTATIRRYGYQEKFGGYTYTYLDVDGYKYWTMGAPLAETIILNRAKVADG